MDIQDTLTKQIQTSLQTNKATKYSTTPKQNYCTTKTEKPDCGNILNLSSLSPLRATILIISNFSNKSQQSAFYSFVNTKTIL